MNMNTLYPFMIFLLLALSMQEYVQAQLTIPAGFQTKYSYDEVTESFYIVNDSSLLKPLDKLKLKHELQIKKVDKYLQPDGSRAVVYEFIAGNQADYNWLTPVKFIKIDQEGVFAFDQNQQLLKQLPHSSYYQDHLNQGDDFFPDFIDLTDIQMDAIQSQGFLIQGNGPERIFKRGNRELVYNPSLLRLSIREYDANHAMNFEKTFQFQSMSDGKKVLKYSSESKTEKLSGGAVATRITIKTLSHQSISSGDKSNKKSSEPATELIRVYPNPVSDMLRLEGDNWFDKTELIRIFTAEGRLIRSIPYDIGSESLISVDGLKKGNYILLLSGSAYQQIVKFIKM